MFATANHHNHNITGQNRQPGIPPFLSPPPPFFRTQIFGPTSLLHLLPQAAMLGAGIEITKGEHGRLFLSPIPLL